ncbi:nitrate reductase cytochrome c-type subunit [Gammaproteobacteria bacterium]|nr:nitrate reductase cytochrome c-type subunit [Gammaproteobacteria bacterium]
MNRLIAGLVALLPLLLIGAGHLDPGRNHPLDSDPHPAAMPKVIDNDRKRARNYPEQPPTIPHRIENYQVDLNVNQCLACHRRDRTAESQAPMVSITHFMDRDGNFLAEVSPRRYFCQQCHVVQTDAQEWVGNEFVDFYDLADDQP